MPVVRCPGCDRQLNVPDSALRVKCPQCSQAFAVTPDGIAEGPPASATVTSPAKAPRPERADRPAERDSGGGTVLVILMAVVAAVVLFAVVGGAATYFLGSFTVFDDMHAEPDVMMPTIAVVEKAPPSRKGPPARAPWTGELLTLEFNDLEWESDLEPEEVPRDEWKNPKAVLNTQTGVLGPKSSLWAHLKGEIEKKNTADSALANGFRSRDKFRNVPEEGALLIGFLIDDSDRFLNYVQPIYLTAAGEKLGPAYGVPDRFGLVGDILRVKARPGYAVGEITVRTGETIDGLGITFMKVTENGLDPNDSYRSPWLGGRDGSTLIVGGDGSFLVGVHGKIAFETGLPDGAAATLGAVRVTANKRE